LENEVIKNQLEKTVFFVGFKDNISEILKNLDIFLFTTHREGLSVAVIEALSSGLPIVATNVGGINEQVFDRVNGFVLDKGDVKGMMEKCIKLIDDKHLRLRMGEKSRIVAEEKFSENRMLNEHIACYREIFEKSKKIK